MYPSITIQSGQHASAIASSVQSTGSGFFDVISAVFPFLFVGAIVFIVCSGVLHYQAARRGGVDPFTVDTELKIRAINSDLLRGSPRRGESGGRGAGQPRYVEARLAALDDLADRGVISAEERSAARLRVLGDN